MTAQEIIAHAKRQAKKGKHPSLSYLGIRNPKKALEIATAESNGAKIEILTFSKKQLYVCVDNGKKWKAGAKFLLLFHKGKQFTSRSSVHAEPNLWEDAKTIYIGIVKESEIEYRKEDHYDFYCALREEQYEC